MKFECLHSMTKIQPSSPHFLRDISIDIVSQHRGNWSPTPTWPSCNDSFSINTIPQPNCPVGTIHVRSIPPPALARWFKCDFYRALFTDPNPTAGEDRHNIWSSRRFDIRRWFVYASADEEPSFSKTLLCKWDSGTDKHTPSPTIMDFAMSS